MIDYAVTFNSCVNGGTQLLGTCYQVGMQTQGQDTKSISPAQCFQQKHAVVGPGWSRIVGSQKHFDSPKL